MDNASGHEGSFRHKRLSVDDYERVISILTQDGRRASVEVDGDKLDSPEHLTASRIAGAREIDVSSYWSDPAKPHWGRRHFVYLVADRAGVRYFGDSDSPEVRGVCAKLGQYLGDNATHAAPRRAVSWFDGPFARLHPSTWPQPYSRVPAWAVLTGLGVLLFLVAFLLGRASVRPDVVTVVVPAQTTTTADTPSTGAAPTAPAPVDNR